MSDNPLRRLVELVTSAPGFMRHVGTRVVSVEPGRVELALDRNPDLVQINGFFHGGVVAGLADHAAGAAVTTAMPKGRFALTVCLQVNFLAPAKGERIVARARTIQAGNTIGVAQVDVVSVDGGTETPCAAATVTLRAVDMPTSPVK